MKLKFIATILTSLVLIFFLYYVLCKNTEKRFDKILRQNFNISEQDFLMKMGKPNFEISGDTCLPGQTCYEYYGFLNKNDICFDSTGSLKSYGSGIRNSYLNGLDT